MIKIKLIELAKTHKVNKKVCFYLSSRVIGVASTLSFLKNKKNTIKTTKVTKYKNLLEDCLFSKLKENMQTNRQLKLTIRNQK